MCSSGLKCWCAGYLLWIAAFVIANYTSFVANYRSVANYGVLVLAAVAFSVTFHLLRQLKLARCPNKAGSLAALETKIVHTQFAHDQYRLPHSSLNDFGSVHLYLKTKRKSFAIGKYSEQVHNVAAAEATIIQ